MSYIGNTPTTQAFTAAIDYFNGTGAQTAFTLSRPVASVAQIQVVVNNVEQNPSSAFSVSGNTLTFTSAPSSGTNNIYVYYVSPITQLIAPGQGTVTTASIVDGNVTLAKLSATGTPSSTTYLRGDNTWATVSGGVTSLTAGTGISVSASTGAVTITNTGITSAVTSAVAGNGITVSAATGAVTFSQDIYTGSTLTNTSYPIGSYVMGKSPLGTGINSTYSLYTPTILSGGFTNTFFYGSQGTGSVAVAGTWRNRGSSQLDIGCSTYLVGSLVQRVA